MMPHFMATAARLSHVYPLGSRLDEDGVLEIGGCNALALAEEFGTPGFFVAEDDLRARARSFVESLRSRHDDVDVLFASKAFPATPVYRVLASEGLSCDVASGGELWLALRGGFDPARIYLHGNAKSRAELEQAIDAGVGHIVVNALDEIERLEDVARDKGVRQAVLIRVTPDVRGETHEKISTGQADSKFGLSLDDARAAITRLRDSEALDLQGLHIHIGSQLLSVEPYQRAIAAIGELGDFPVYNLGGGLGVAYTAQQEPPAIDAWVQTITDAAHEHLPAGARLLIEPGRALVANSCVTLYRVESVKRGATVTYVAVDGGMSDNLRPMLYDAEYEAEVVGRFGGEQRYDVVGKHCESGDVIVKDVPLDDPRPGDVIVTPATGAYGYAMANNYNGIPRAPVVFCRDGDARVVVRRETFEDLAARDIG
jgi:diaminopimelate decarboxylase